MYLFLQDSDSRVRSSRDVWAMKKATEKQKTNKDNVQFVKLILSNTYEKTDLNIQNSYGYKIFCGLPLSLFLLSFIITLMATLTHLSTLCLVLY